MPKHFLVNRETQKRYEIVGIDGQTKTVTLKGLETGAVFEDKFDPKFLKELGYDLVEETADA
jgi:hypothetical protein